MSRGEASMATGRYQSKYYNKIIAAQKTPPDAGKGREFDFIELGGGGAVGRLAAWVIGSRLVYAILRNFFPVLRFSSFCVVSRYDDVQEVLQRSDVFETPFKLEMPELAGGENFVLGMSPGADHDRQKKHIVGAMLLPGGIDDILAPSGAGLAGELVEVSDGQIDAIH